VEWTVPVKQCKRVGLVCNDSATFILLLHYTPCFQAHELKELWQLYTTGKKRCMLPVHQAVSRLGEPLARAVNKTHVLTGDDCMSKLGNEHTAVVCDCIVSTWQTVEKQTHYQTKTCLEVLSTCLDRSQIKKTFDQLRMVNYTSATSVILALPATTN